MQTSNHQHMTYAQAGVSIATGEQVVSQIEPHLRRTYGPRVLGRFGAFAGCFRLDYNERLFKRNYRDPVLLGCADGVGTKVKLAVQLNIHDTIGQDVVAMNVNDLIVQGAEPLFFLDYIGIHKVDPVQAEQIVKGVADGCKLAGCALLGGETAEMPEIYQPGDYDLAGFAVGVCELKRLVSGERVKADDVILGLASSGLHSNGYTLARAIIRKAKLDLDRIYPDCGSERTLGQIMLEPTRIYARQVIRVFRHYRVKRPIGGMSHITGGGLPGNLERVLPAHLNARIGRESWTVPGVFSLLQRSGGVEDDEMFRVFNMGIGYVMIVRPHFAGSIARQLRRAGETVFELGKIVRGTGRVLLV